MKQAADCCDRGCVRLWSLHQVFPRVLPSKPLSLLTAKSHPGGEKSARGYQSAGEPRRDD